MYTISFVAVGAVLTFMKSPPPHMCTTTIGFDVSVPIDRQPSLFNAPLPHGGWLVVGDRDRFENDLGSRLQCGMFRGDPCAICMGSLCGHVGVRNGCPNDLVFFVVESTALFAREKRDGRTSSPAFGSEKSFG